MSETDRRPTNRSKNKNRTAQFRNRTGGAREMMERRSMAWRGMAYCVHSTAAVDGGHHKQRVGEGLRVWRCWLFGLEG